MGGWHRELAHCTQCDATKYEKRSRIAVDVCQLWLSCLKSSCLQVSVLLELEKCKMESEIPRRQTKTVRTIAELRRVR